MSGNKILIILFITLLLLIILSVFSCSSSQDEKKETIPICSDNNTFLDINGSCVEVEEYGQKMYDKGEFNGYFNSQFIDCTLPSINQTMEIIYYDESINGNIDFQYLNWEVLCGRLYQTIR